MYSVKVFSTHPFMFAKAESLMKHTYNLIIPDRPGGGVPSDPGFYSNPQFCFYLDKERCFNGGVGVEQMNVICSFESSSEASVKLFLCKANASFKRFKDIKEDNLFDRN